MTREGWIVRLVIRQTGGSGSNSDAEHVLDLNFRAVTRRDVEESFEQALKIVNAMPRRDQ
jgi:hypothetical protein